MQYFNVNNEKNDINMRSTYAFYKPKDNMNDMKLESIWWNKTNQVL